MNAAEVMNTIQTAWLTTPNNREAELTTWNALYDTLHPRHDAKVEENLEHFRSMAF